MSEVRGFKPIEITPAMVVESSLFETAPATYAAGTTYALGVYASVAGLLGEILIYKSLQAANIGNTPTSSPTWWAYSSSTYGVYNPLTSYAVGHRIIDAVSHTIKESVFSGNIGFSLDNSPSWRALESAGRYDQTLPFYVGTTTYTAGAVVISDDASAGDPNHMTWPVYKSKSSSNVGHGPDISPIFWLFVGYSSPIYAPEATYAIGEVVSDGKGNYYECLFASTKGKPLTGKTAWLEIAPSNPVAMFDGETDTQSVATGEMSFTINAGVFDSVALIGCEGAVAYVTVRDGLGGTVVFDEAQGISGNIVSDWWAFTYGDATFPLKKAVFTDIPPFANAHVTIKIVGDAAVKLGTVDIGSMQSLGMGAQYGASVDLKDYSIKKTDEFGKTSFVRRGFKEVMDVQILLDKSEFLRVYNIFTDLRSTPWFIQASDDPDWGQALSHHGFYNSFRPVIEYPTHAIYSLQFESLVTS